MSEGAKRVLSIIGLILGILSIIFFWTMIFSIILGVIAIIFAALSIKSYKGMCIAAIVLAVIGIILSVLMGMVFMAFFPVMSGIVAVG